MSQSKAFEQLRAALEESRKRDPNERFREMVEEGVIDEEGNVLLKSPWDDIPENHDRIDSRIPSPSEVYPHETNEIPLLSESEEKELAEAIAAGDRDAKNRLIRANLRLVVKIAREYGGRGLMLDDLIGEGNLGLIRAAEEYDPRFGTRFSTYASYWIKQSIRHALINTTGNIRLSAHTTKWRRIGRILTRQLGSASSADEVAHPIGPIEAVDLNRIFERLNHLEPREATIIRMRFGLEPYVPMTRRAVGNDLGLPHKSVRRLEYQAMIKLMQTSNESADHPSED